MHKHTHTKCYACQPKTKCPETVQNEATTATEPKLKIRYRYKYRYRATDADTDTMRVSVNTDAKTEN